MYKLINKNQYTVSYNSDAIVWLKIMIDVLMYMYKLTIKN